MNTSKQNKPVADNAQKDSHSKSLWKQILGGLFKGLWRLLRLIVTQPWLLVTILLLVAGLVLLHYCSTGSLGVKLESPKSIAVTPEEITRIREIQQWEFLTSSTEEYVDSTETHFLGDKVIVRIYQGTLRLGINMQNAPKDWFTARADTAFLKLPSVTLLDPNFIDEANTKTFYQKGSWSAESKNALYQIARKKMLQRCYTTTNVAKAEAEAMRRFTDLFEAFGFHAVIIKFV